MFWGYNFENNLRYPKITNDFIVYAGFHDAQQYIPDPPQAQSTPNQHYEENMDAWSDQEEMGQASNKFIQRLERQEKKGFKDLASLLSHLPKTAQGFACPAAWCLWQAMEGIGG